MEKHVLIASADPDFCAFLGHILADDGFSSSVIDPAEVPDEEAIRRVAAIVVESSDQIGRLLAFCRRVRTASMIVPMMALVRTQHERYYLPLMKAGVDECVLRPLGPDLIVSCLESVIEKKRSGHDGAAAQPRTHYPDLALDEELRLLRGGAGSVQLTPTEYRLLKRLLADPGHLVSRKQLIEAAWPTGRNVEPRTVDVHIGKLRRALQTTTGRKVIRTIRSSGFVADTP